MKNLVGKNVNLNLIDDNGDALHLIGQFAKQAKREGWKEEEINKVKLECMNGDYDHVISVLLAHANIDEFEDSSDEEEEEEEQFI